ncbi:type II toxin-antitoxin system YafQ family toxin [Tritonibacter multivorans]|uniref:type II toxin-antitoxin system YafQ family toxin n=1 Tax=Tritonibacter multivorans TaxID=928856 RepID=UPI0008E0C8BE|nr:type II toxin-antitoxin system YafQ family toxin [Tritonibacter multivorans]MDA7423050.1 type II toxin-antitoxin system YafQ family toxin [Tritonibacter multivorans]SFD81243.1 mRNA interferase YafQ [Tritonibacter multivorans]
MKTVSRTSRFKKDFKREMKTDAGVKELLMDVVSSLVEGKALPEKMRDHPLSGDWKDHRDCHLKPDLVLIYKTTDDEVTLARIGSHSELF